ncbi:MAG: glycoside hydrolase family 32 protein [Blautia sp.]|nr:glycoside hydrolase family 32 protein [Blautia sp.]
MKNDVNIRQSLHLKAPGNWINDPNGFIFYRGRYHLFYQHNPEGPVWDTMHWGHAVSDDLVHWEHLGIALYPSVREDMDGVFSGSAVESEGKMHLFYTGIRYLDKEHTRIESAQLHIMSEDGVEFDNRHGKQVILPPFPDREAGEEHPWNADFPHLSDLFIGDRGDTRDPKVWKGQDGNWYMILGTTENEHGKAIFYRSTDLSAWDFAGACTAPENWGCMWECPDLLYADGQAVLTVSPMRLGENGKFTSGRVICIPADFREEDCRLELADTYQFFDLGSDLYAPQSTLDRNGQRVVVAWLRMPKEVCPGSETREEAAETGGIPWNGMYCLPRAPKFRNGHVFFPIHPEVKERFRPVQTDEPAEWLQKNGAGKKMLRFSLQEGQQADLGGYLIERKEGKLRTDRNKVFVESPESMRTACTPPLSEACVLEVVLDPHMIEIYINDGEYVITHCVYGLSDSFRFPEGVCPEIHMIAEDGGNSAPLCE